MAGSPSCVRSSTAAMNFWCRRWANRKRKRQKNSIGSTTKLGRARRILDVPLPSLWVLAKKYPSGNLCVFSKEMTLDSLIHRKSEIARARVTSLQLTPQNSMWPMPCIWRFPLSPSTGSLSSWKAIYQDFSIWYYPKEKGNGSKNTPKCSLFWSDSAPYNIKSEIPGKYVCMVEPKNR